MKSPTRLQRVAGRLLGMVPVAQLMKDRRSAIMMRTDMDPADVAKILVPDWNYNRLLDLAETSWILGMVYDAIIREALSQGWSKEPRFIKKCVNDQCGKEFQSAVATCDACGSSVRDPNAEQGQRLEMLMRDPNPDQELDAILKSVMWQSLAVDDWFLSIVYRNLGTVQPTPENQTVQALRVAAGNLG